MLMIILVFALLFATSSVNAKDIAYNSSGLSIKIQDLNYKIYNKEGFQQPVIFHNDYAISHFKNIAGYSLQTIIFQLAAPDTSTPNINIKIHKFKSIGQVKLYRYFDSTGFEQSSDFKFIKPQAKSKYLGIQRGVNVHLIEFLPYQYVDNSLFLIDSAEIDINFKTKPLEQKLVTYYQSDPFYDNLINRLQVPYFKKSNSKLINSSIENILNNDQWYNPAIEYLKIETTKDGIVVIKMSDILQIYPQWKNRESRHLHLLHFGKPYPVYVFDENGKIDDADSIIFKGLRPLGDTTWIDYVSTFEPFYLYYDESVIGTRLKLANQNINSIDYKGTVLTDLHIEEDKEYWEGKDIADFNTSANEGYYWKLLDQSRPNSFEYELFLLLGNKSEDVINIQFKTNYRDSAYHVNLGRWVRPYYQLQFFLNDELVEEVAFNELKQKIFYADNNRNKLITGLNKIKLNSLQSDPFKLGMTLIDYIKVLGYQKPYAKNGESTFILEKKSENISIEVPSFSSNNIVAIDTINQLLFLPLQTNKGSHFIVSTFGAKVFLSLNHTYYSSESKGLHLAYLSTADLKTVKTIYFSDFSEALYQLLDTLKSGSILIGLYNGTSSIPQRFQNLLSDMGLSKYKNLNTNNWYFAIEKFGSYAKEETGRNLTLDDYIIHQNGTVYSAKFNFESGKEYHLHINDATKFEYPRIKKVESTTLKNTDFNSELIIITHEDFYEQAVRLSQHRQSTHKINIAITKIDDIYKEFKYGKKSPYAIKDYLKNVYHKWQRPPKYVLLFGDASFDPHKFLEFSNREDYIPSYGWPVTDYWYTLLDGNDLMPEVILTRLPVASLKEAEDVVSKIIFYDTIPNRPWMKKFLWLSGGITDNERDKFYEARIPYFFDFVMNKNICGDTLSVRKNDPAVGGEMEANHIKKYINDGVQWTCFLGHASVLVYDMDGWQVERLNNNGRYGFYTTISCSSGDFGYSGANSRNETYLLAPDRGFIATAGGSSTSRWDVDLSTLINAMRHLTNENKRQFSDIIFYGKTRTYEGSIWSYRGLFYFHVLGDPLISFKIDTVPDLYMLNSDISVISDKNSSIIDESNQFAIIRGKVHNAGTKYDEPVKLILHREYEGNIFTEELLIDPICLYTEFEFLLPVQNMPGKHNITIVVNPNYENGEINVYNNVINFVLEVYTTGLMPLDPLAFWSIEGNNPKFRFINPRSGQRHFKYKFEIANDNNFNNLIYTSLDVEVLENEAFLEWKPSLILSSPESYWIRAKLIDINDDGNESPWLIIPFNTTNNDISNNSVWKISSEEQFRAGVLQNIEYDTNKGGIRLKQTQLPFIAFGLFGTETNIRYSRISVNEVDYVNQEWARGFNVVTVNMFTGKAKYKQFDTWISPKTCEDFVIYLKDSIRTDEYVLIASNDAAFWTPMELAPNEPGYIDSIFAALELYGVTITEQFTKRASFAMFGWKYAPSDSIMQMVNEIGDTAIVQGFLTIFDTTGTYITPKIGPAKKWNQLKLTGSKSDAGANLQVVINGFRNNGEIDEIILADNINVYDLSFIDSEIYRDIQIKLNLSINDRNIENLINSIDLDFVPADELAILLSRTGIESLNLMRGFKNKFDFTIKNISPRVFSTPTILNFEIHSTSEETLYEINDTVGTLNPDAEYLHSREFLTENLLSENRFYFLIDKHQKNPELYRFNNTYSLVGYIFEDTLKPSAIIYADDVKLSNYDWVRSKPLFRIEIYDDSPLGINSELIKVRLNSKILTRENTDFYNFIEINDNSNLKGILEFQPREPLDYTIYTGDLQPKGNLLITYLADRTGNRDTLFNYINVSRDIIIENVQNYPNPFSHSTKISFDYKSFDFVGKIKIEFYDIYGKLIDHGYINPIIGNNTFEWWGRSSDGTSLSTGVYFYRLKIISEYYAEPVFGKIFIVR